MAYRIFRGLCLAWLAVACTDTPPPRSPALTVPADERPETVGGVVSADVEQPAQRFDWQSWSKETFDKARAEKRFILIYGSAAWCHWCHVMEESTFRDPGVGRLIQSRFVAIKVDVDARPDIEERYGKQGWPTTVLLTPDGEELGQFSGFMPPEELRPILERVEEQGMPPRDVIDAAAPGPASAPVAALDWVMLRTLRDMGWYYDPREGGWGTRQKAPLGENIQVDLRRGARGDDDAMKRAVFSLDRQSVLIDPVWGGIYQYSSGGTWRAPHFEKLLGSQAVNLEAYALAYQLTTEERQLERARSILSYVERFLTSDAGAFYASQDADVGTHDPDQEVTDGAEYYPKDESQRLEMGIPWVDKHVYAQENGMMIAALVALHRAVQSTGDREDGTSPLALAQKAYDVVRASHVASDGSVKRDAESDRDVRYLVDAAAFGRGACELSRITGDSEQKATARLIATHMRESFRDPDTGAYFSHTEDPAAFGVFAERERPLGANVEAARFFACLGRIERTEADREEARRILAAIATPAALDEQGRMLGGFLLALDDAGIRLPGESLPRGKSSTETAAPAER